MLLGSVGWLKLMAHRRRVEWVNESLIEDGVMGCRGIHGEGGVFFFFFVKFVLVSLKVLDLSCF